MVQTRAIDKITSRCLLDAENIWWIITCLNVIKIILLWFLSQDAGHTGEAAHYH